MIESDTTPHPLATPRRLSVTIARMFTARLATALALSTLALVACSPATPSPTAPDAPTRPAPDASIVASAPTAASSAPAVAAAADAGSAADAGVSLDIIYVPTPQKVVDKMLEVAKVTRSDVVYDLGCGDGRIVVTAARKLGAHGLGFDLDPDRVTEALANVQRAGVAAAVSIRRENVFDVDLSPATVVTLYLLPEINVRLIPQLEKLRPGSRIVSHDFDMEGVIPDGHWKIMAPEFVNDEGYSAYKGGAVPEDKKNYKERAHDIYLWTVPLKKAPPRAADAGAGDGGKKP
jgi:SAM-dependent methyltransferase